MNLLPLTFTVFFISEMVFFASVYTFFTLQELEGVTVGKKEKRKGGKGEGQRESKLGRERERTWQTPYTLYPDMFTSYAVDIQSRSNCGKNDATSDVRTLGLQPENFHIVHGSWPDFSFGQTLRLFHAECTIASSEVLRSLTDSFTASLPCLSHSSFPIQVLGEGSKGIGQRSIEQRPVGEFWVTKLK